MPIWGYILTACIAGGFALLGSFLGSRLEWKSRHRAWLLEKRAEIFAEFLKTLNTCSKEGIDLTSSKGLDQLGIEEISEIRHRFIDIYWPARDLSTVVRLFLKEKSRNRFTRLVGEIQKIHSKELRSKDTFKNIGGKRKEINRMFEEHLKDLEW